MAPKIATCSYCGTRAALVFDEGLHELTCRACGAPLHEMKFMPHPSDKVEKRRRDAKPDRQTSRRRPVPEHMRREWRDWPARKRPKRRRKPIAKRMLEELWDVVEDIFD
ncbi:hypothetical protein [Roseovarius phycicola]|uniref:TFIIB-type domain-containing protein n=1 Tax=Roseovarius phycicola TaxID=3080976 RepID=A0ABZ2HP11_9RHOB